MWHVTRIRNLRRLASTAALVGLMFLGAPVSAQQAPTPPPAPAAPAGPVLQLSMEQAVTMALESNLALKAERLNLDVAAQGIALARASFLPVLSSRVGRTTSKSVPGDFTQGSTDISSRGMSGSATFSQNLRWYGGGYSVTWAGNRNSQVGGISNYNPRLGSSFTVSFSQPLWRDLRTDSGRVALETSERRRAITDIQLEQQIVATDVAARLLYLNLVAALERLKVAQQNLDIRQVSLKQALARVAVGASAQIEVIQAEADVASNREEVIRAQAGISAAEDSLRTVILDPSRADYWQVRIEPTDTIQLTPREIDVDAAIKNALASRLDLIVERRNLEITDLNLNLNRNSTLPAIDVGLIYSAQGTGGTQFQFGSGFPPPILSRTDRSFGSVLNDTFLGAYPSWTVGATVSYPLGRTAAEATLAQGQVQKRQQELALREAELEIVRQVRDAARQVQNSLERIQATRAALESTVQQLTAEERRFAVGLSTTLEMQTRQSQLASARVNELNARIDYNRALINFDRVQKTR